MENRDIRIAFFDIDGTLLPPDHHLPESTVAVSYTHLTLPTT